MLVIQILPLLLNGILEDVNKILMNKIFRDEYNASIITAVSLLKMQEDGGKN